LFFSQENVEDVLTFYDSTATLLVIPNLAKEQIVKTLQFSIGHVECV